FLVDVRLDRRVADVGVDLHAGHLADRHGIESLCEVIHVRGNDQPPPGDLVAHQLNRELLALRDAFHLGSHRALAGEVHLGDAAHTRVSLTETGAGSGERYPTANRAAAAHRSEPLPAPRSPHTSI